MAKIAIIGGTGLTSLEELKIVSSQRVDTPYGPPSSELVKGELAGKEVMFLARHGKDHTIPPHKINYRANIWALQSVGVKEVIGIAAVGGIHKDIPPEKITIPDQIIDYTYDRKHTFFDEALTEVTHIDFTQPYSEALRQKLLQASLDCKIKVYKGGVYGATQGPRLESAAEVKRLENDGCDIVGMTGMPEASLAKELCLDYACCALSVNWAAGKVEDEITMDNIREVIDTGMVLVKKIIIKFLLNH
ncbi:MAG: S-methyl-5'-thioinosine phosphorylase [Gammaproteobacteria bacterium]